MTTICIKTAIFGLTVLVSVFVGGGVLADTPDGTINHTASDLIHALTGEDAVARFMAYEQLIEMREVALPLLRPLATSPGFTVPRQYALHILAHIDSAQSIHLLLRILEQEPDIRVRALICRHIGQLGVEEAVPIIGKWLFTIRGKPLMDWNGPYVPHILTPAYGWLVHVHALREIGSEKGIGILQQMLGTKHEGNAGKALMKAYQTNLSELQREAEFWNAVQSVPGLEPDVKLLFQFFRRDTLARMRLYRDKVLRLGLEGRWVLEGMKNQPDEKLSRASVALLNVYDDIRGPTSPSAVDEP